MKRREFITLLGGAAAAWPVAARAQPAGRMRRIGVLWPNPERDLSNDPGRAVFQAELRKLGWVDGRNIRIDSRFGGGDGSRIQALAAELVATAPDAIMASGTPCAVALRQLTRTIPIVFANLPDPIANGLVTSLARPGGNITGFAQYEQTLAAKQLESSAQRRA